MNLNGNAEKYDVKNVLPLENSPLNGKNILFLGSSVTYGWAAQGTSFADYIAKRNEATVIKEAVSGTTLVCGVNSYVKRLKNVDKTLKSDLFVCQLSTNDATQNKPLGTVDDDNDETICGAINKIIAYVTQTFDCRVIFYTNAYYANENYANMVNALYKIAKLKKIGIIDLYNAEKFNDITPKLRKLYMADEIHPTKAGYLEWWTPQIEKYLYKFIN